MYPKYLLALLYEEQGDLSKAVECAVEIVNESAKVDSRAIREMKNDMALLIKRNANQNSENK
jgi:hypothetical protein